MKRYNIILLADVKGENVLMCRRMKPPYQGLYNLVGGKAELGEDGLHAAYRELREETGVTAADTVLHHLATFAYPNGGAGLKPYELQAYVGRLNREVQVQGDENPLLWMPATENFFDLERFAGEGSIGHVMESARRYCSELLQSWETEAVLERLVQADLPVLAWYQGIEEMALLPMLKASEAGEHEGRFYRAYAIHSGACMVGWASLHADEAGCCSEGIEIFPPFRSCGFAAAALKQLEQCARDNGFAALTAQVRTDNDASMALHRRLCFAQGPTWTNRKGNEVVTFRKQL